MTFDQTHEIWKPETLPTRVPSSFVEKHKTFRIRKWVRQTMVMSKPRTHARHADSHLQRLHCPVQLIHVLLLRENLQLHLWLFCCLVRSSVEEKCHPQRCSTPPKKERNEFRRRGGGGQDGVDRRERKRASGQKTTQKPNTNEVGKRAPPSTNRFCFREEQKRATTYMQFLP